MDFAKKWLVALVMMGVHFTAFPQDTPVNKLDSLSLKKDRSGKQINNINEYKSKGLQEQNATDASSLFNFIGRRFKAGICQTFSCQ